MALAQERGLVIPEDIAFIGFTDGILSKYARPRLTTVAQHGEEMGERAARLLIDRVEAKEGLFMPYVTETVSATLIQREST